MKKKKVIRNELIFSVSFDAFEQLPRDVWGWLIKYIADFKCESCGCKVRLHSHHMDQNSENNCISNGLCLCEDCHIKMHQALREIKKIDEVMMLRTWDAP